MEHLADHVGHGTIPQFEYGDRSARGILTAMKNRAAVSLGKKSAEGTPQETRA